VEEEEKEEKRRRRRRHVAVCGYEGWCSLGLLLNVGWVRARSCVACSRL
jgi:hypothetical protein